MQRNGKSKKKTIEKLRMILDNPYNKDLHVEDGKCLDTLRVRLVKPSTEDFVYIREKFEGEDDSLKANVIIHRREEDNFVIPEFKQVEPEDQRTEEQNEDPFKDEELYEIEKVETHLPEFVEVKTEGLTKEEKVPSEEKSDSLESEKDDVIKPLESIDEELPEWEPADTEETKFEEIKEEKPEHEKELQGWEPILSEKPEEGEKELPAVEKPKEEILESKEEGQIDVFRGVSSIDGEIAKLLYENGITSVDALRETPIRELTKIKGIRRKFAKKIKKEVGEAPEKTDDENKWQIADSEPSGSDIEESKDADKEDSPHRDKVLEQKSKEIKRYKHGDYALYSKEIKVGQGKKRTIRFFSRTEPEDGEPVDLPDGYEVKVNKKTGVPYIRKKK